MFTKIILSGAYTQMQIQERQDRGQRNLDLVRLILYAIEQDQKFDALWKCEKCDFFIGYPEELGILGHSREEFQYHLRLLTEAGLVASGGSGPLLSGERPVRGLTWDGHEFLENIKTDWIWEKVKKQASGLTGVGMKVLATLAEAEVKRHLGIG
jgi:hypothetical protein